MNYLPKLIELALPMEDINSQSAREKSIRLVHPSTLHLWWARRPLAAYCAVLFASLMDDPDSDPQFLKREGSVDICRQNKRPAEALTYNSLVIAWPEIARLARKAKQVQAETKELF